MNAASAEVLIMARAPRRGQVRLALEPLLGPERCLELQSALIVEAVRWANETAPGHVHIAHDPPDAAREMRDLVDDRAALFPQNGQGIARRLDHAAARVFAHSELPLLIVWPDLPRLRADHATAALDDLQAGCEIVLGPAIDGGFYLIGLARPLPELFALPEESWRKADAMTIVITAVREAGLEVGILRAERPLHRPADVRATLADPLAPEGLRRILSGAS